MTGGTTSTRQKLRRIIFFFPVQLVFLHIKQNHLLLVFWLILFGYVTQSIGAKFGIPYLFLYPEYMGEVNLKSHLIMGFALGGFIMAFNIYSYVMHARKFPFIATLARPFLKFCINNFIVPGIFIVTYIIFAIYFQLDKEFLSVGEVAVNMIGLVIGLFIFFLFSLFYFFRTNKDIFKLTGKKREQLKEPIRETTVSNVLHKKMKWYHLKTEKGWLVLTYMSHPFKIALARHSGHYDKEMLQRVFVQNHINASIFEIGMLVSFLVLGSFREVALFQIPAGASIILLFTMILMLISAFYSWFKGWTFAILVGALVLLNIGSSHFKSFSFENQAYGLNYKTERATYTTETLVALRNNVANYKNDRSHTIEILNNWRLKNVHHSNGEKPKLIIINTSGGGLRSALWTMHIMQHLDSTTNGEFMEHTTMITGSSGGMIGAAYLRELYLQKMQGDLSISLSDQEFRNNIAKDILNPVGLAIATNDMFIRYQTFKDGDYTYTKDRAYAFEKQLSENLNHVLDKRVMDYSIPVEEGLIPMMVFAPSVVNDGRRLLISSQPISYLANNLPDSSLHSTPLVEDIEFMRFFEHQDAANLGFGSAMRMSATFPYIMPTVTMPSEPPIEVMDAGLRDNIGAKSTLQYLYTFRDWISSNTSGVIIVQMRDQRKDFEAGGMGSGSMLESFTSPLGAMYSNIFKIQEYTQDQMLQHASLWFDGEIDVVHFSLPHDRIEPISLSWHLTAFEKQQISRGLYTPEHIDKVKLLKGLLE
jgi:ABC-type multidrug transport system fused ATPase/permease subunit